MDKKNTILAIVLSVLVITIGMTIQATFFAPATPEVVPTTERVQTSVSSSDSGQSTYLAPAQSSQVSANIAWDSSLPGSMVAVGNEGNKTPFTFETNYFLIEFNPNGASIASFKLKDHLDEGEPVELLFKDATSNDAFLMYAGNDKTNPIDATFRYQIIGNQVQFTQEFALLEEDGKTPGEPFSITKTYTFGEEDYLFLKLM